MSCLLDREWDVRSMSSLIGCSTVLGCLRRTSGCTCLAPQLKTCDGPSGPWGGGNDDSSLGKFEKRTCKVGRERSAAIRDKSPWEECR
ncbi:hypothetical protein BCR44DRAFT_1440194 [Catenaria anguillulae PL171]|uniref:Uncharacterized protein n=1 Tax=Catenaria anguillulae PL171 TaxID=765915 RepID=A0A1Y2HEJ4_9FUNG|nr:hypothetical protein BCR44DRAFT_1440194 [Catenaria anguillulae PL171]